MKKLKISLVKTSVIISLICSVYIVLSVGVGLAPTFKTWWSEELIQKVNNILLNLSYSYIAGIIFYTLVSYLPDQNKKRRFQPIVKREIKRIHSLFLGMINSMSSKKEKVHFENIPDYKTFERLMESVSPNELYPQTNGQITEASYLKTLLYLKIETLEIIKHIYYYKNQMPDEIILLLEDLMNSKFFKAVIMWNSWKYGCGNENMKEFSADFYDGFKIVEELNEKAKGLYKGKLSELK